MALSAADIAGLVGGRVYGAPEVELSGVNSLDDATTGELSFVRDGRYRARLLNCRASAVLIAEPVEEWPGTQIIVAHPDLAFVRVLHYLAAAQPAQPVGKHDLCAIASDAVLGEGVALDAFVRIEAGARLGARVVCHAGVYVGRDCTIGDDSVLYPNAVLREGTTLGKRCIVHANASIGSDGFGFAPIDGQWMKIPQVGRVVIGDDCEIGSNTAIDRATFGETRIGNGVKIDNLCQIGHNCRIGDHTAIAGTVGIAGSAIIGKHVRIGASAGIAGHLTIGDGATIGARAGVTGDVPAGATVSGFPAVDHNRQKRIMVGTGQLPELIKRVRELERQIAALHALGEKDDPRAAR